MTGRSKGDSRHAPRVFVDAENVRRSVWPNIPRDELVELVDEWAEREGVRPVVVFEGTEIADDRIARETAELDDPYWLVTSDRGLRERAAQRAERVIGGGSFARELRDLATAPAQPPNGQR
jgi:predicted ATP-grasp superfamily ATP-dependent carboligase